MRRGGWSCRRRSRRRWRAMVPALLGAGHGDGALSSWQGGGPATRDALAAVIEASGVRTRPLRQARDWGYQRLAAGSAVLVVDAAPPPVARVVEGGCASTLAFEFSDGPHRIVVNCGGARAGVAPLPASLAEGLRTTAAHSTLVLARQQLDRDPRRRDARPRRRRRSSSAGRNRTRRAGSRRATTAMSAAWASVHRRQLILTGDGRELRGEDALLPARPPAPRRRDRASRSASTWDWASSASPTADGQARASCVCPAAACGSSAAAAPRWASRTACGSTARDGRARPGSWSSPARRRRAARSVSWALKRAGRDAAEAR